MDPRKWPEGERALPNRGRGNRYQRGRPKRPRLELVEVPRTHANPFGFGNVRSDRCVPLPDDHPLNMELADVRHQLRLREVYWEGLAREIPDEMDNPGSYDYQRRKAEMNSFNETIGELLKRINLAEQGRTPVDAPASWAYRPTESTRERSVMSPAERRQDKTRERLRQEQRAALNPGPEQQPLNTRFDRQSFNPGTEVQPFNPGPGHQSFNPGSQVQQLVTGPSWQPLNLGPERQQLHTASQRTDWRDRHSTEGYHERSHGIVWTPDVQADAVWTFHRDMAPRVERATPQTRGPQDDLPLFIGSDEGTPPPHSPLFFTDDIYSNHGDVVATDVNRLAELRAVRWEDDGYDDDAVFDEAEAAREAERINLAAAFMNQMSVEMSTMNTEQPAIANAQITDPRLRQVEQPAPIEMAIEGLQHEEMMIEEGPHQIEIPAPVQPLPATLTAEDGAQHIEMPSPIRPLPASSQRNSTVERAEEADDVKTVSQTRAPTGHMPIDQTTSFLDNLLDNLESHAETNEIENLSPDAREIYEGIMRELSRNSSDSSEQEADALRMAAASDTPAASSPVMMAESEHPGPVSSPTPPQAATSSPMILAEPEQLGSVRSPSPPQSIPVVDNVMRATALAALEAIRAEQEVEPAQEERVSIGHEELSASGVESPHPARVKSPCSTDDENHHSTGDKNSCPSDDESSLSSVNENSDSTNDEPLASKLRSSQQNRTTAECDVKKYELRSIQENRTTTEGEAQKRKLGSFQANRTTPDDDLKRGKKTKYFLRDGVTQPGQMKVADTDAEEETDSASEYQESDNPEGLKENTVSKFEAVVPKTKVEPMLSRREAARRRRVVDSEESSSSDEDNENDSEAQSEQGEDSRHEIASVRGGGGTTRTVMVYGSRLIIGDLPPREEPLAGRILYITNLSDEADEDHLRAALWEYPVETVVLRRDWSTLPMGQGWVVMTQSVEAESASEDHLELSIEGRRIGIHQGIVTAEFLSYYQPNATTGSEDCAEEAGVEIQGNGQRASEVNESRALTRQHHSPEEETSSARSSVPIKVKENLTAPAEDNQDVNQCDDSLSAPAIEAPSAPVQTSQPQPAIASTSQPLAKAGLAEEVYSMLENIHAPLTGIARHQQLAHLRFVEGQLAEATILKARKALGVVLTVGQYKTINREEDLQEYRKELRRSLGKE